MDSLEEQLAIRDRFMQRRAWSMTPAQRMEAFAKLQAEAWERLRQSPEGYAHFLRRNFKARAIDASQFNGE